MPLCRNPGHQKVNVAVAFSLIAKRSDSDYADADLVKWYKFGFDPLKSYCIRTPNILLSYYDKAFSAN
jgi:hypothetical protein